MLKQYDEKTVIFEADIAFAAGTQNPLDVNGNPMKLPQGFRPTSAFVNTTSDVASAGEFRLGTVTDNDAFLATSILGTQLKGFPMQRPNIGRRLDTAEERTIIVDVVTTIPSPNTVQMVFTGYFDT